MKACDCGSYCELDPVLFREKCVSCGKEYPFQSKKIDEDVEPFDEAYKSLERMAGSSA